MGFWPVVLTMLRNVDIVVLVADARLPELSMNQELVRKIAELALPSVVVFSKIDLVSKEHLLTLQKLYRNACLVSGTQNKGVTLLKRRLQIMAKRLHLAEPRIGVVGYPNLGKSALINALAHRKKAAVMAMPGTTRNVQWVRAGGLRILDSPGVIPFDDKSRKLALIGSKSADKLSAPERNALDIISLFVRKAPQRLKEFYHLSELAEHPYDILLAIGAQRNFLKKGGVIDEDRTTRTIIREWQQGKLKL